MNKFYSVIWALLLSVSCCVAASLDNSAAKIAPLIDPAKLATLGTRGANPRVQKYVYWLEVGRRDKADPAKVVDAALLSVRVTGQAAALTKAAMLRNLTIATRLGCLDAEGMAEMRQGKSPTVQRGPYKGDQLSVDHIIPRSVVPELDNVVANLELMPARMNSKKNARIGQRQRDFAGKLQKAGLLSKDGLKTVGALH